MGKASEVAGITLITVATLNLRGRHDRWLRRRELVVAEFLDARPDLISLQEIYLPIGQARWLRSQINARISGSGKSPYQLVQSRRRYYLRGYLEGIGILTKLPVLSHDYVNLGYGGRIALRANVELSSGEPLDFVATHLHPVAEDQEAREEQVMRLMGWLNERNPVALKVIAGDFNELPAGPAIRLMKQQYRSVFEEKWGHEPLATFPTALGTELRDWSGCLDYIFISGAVRKVKEVRIFCNRPSAEDPTIFPSDHVGLLAALNLFKDESSLNGESVKPSETGQ